jgi:hypothetical protein
MARVEPRLFVTTFLKSNGRHVPRIGLQLSVVSIRHTDALWRGHHMYSCLVGRLLGQSFSVILIHVEKGERFLQRLHS